MLGAGEVVAQVLERAGEASRPLGLLVGDEHLDDVVREQLAGQELRVVAVVLPALVGRGPLHLRHRPNDAVDAHISQSAHEMEARDARLVDGLGLGEPQDPLGDGGGVVPEGLREHLAGVPGKRDCGDGPSVNIKADCGSIRHGEPLSVCAATRPAAGFGTTRPLSAPTREISKTVRTRGSQCSTHIVFTQKNAGQSST